MSAETWERDVYADLALSPPADRGLCEAEEPAGEPQDPRVLGYAAARRRGSQVNVLGPSDTRAWAAERDVKWWQENGVPSAFVVELREVPR